MLYVFYGCEGFTHPWEGREALGEGHKLGLTMQLRKLPHEEGLLILWSMGSIKAMNLVFFGRYKEVLVNEEEMIIEGLERKIQLQYVVYVYGGLERQNALAICCLCCYNISSLKSPPSPKFL